MKALIIDDEIDICFLLSSVLKQKNLDISIAHNLNEGLGKVGNLEPEVIFLDNYLPDGKGLNAIKNVQSANGLLGYSVSNIEPDDMTTAMNYMGQELGTALFKALHELPISLRKPEILLRGIEALLANLLSQKFDSSHQILDSLCEHVHMTLDDLKQRQH